MLVTCALCSVLHIPWRACRSRTERSRQQRFALCHWGHRCARGCSIRCVHTHTLTNAHMQAQMRTPTHAQAHEPWACVRASSGVPRCHDCRSPKVSSEPRHPRKRNRRKGDGRHGRLLNGHRMPLTLARSGHELLQPAYMLALGPRADMRRQACHRQLNRQRRRCDQALLQPTTARYTARRKLANAAQYLVYRPS